MPLFRNNPFRSGTSSTALFPPQPTPASPGPVNVRGNGTSSYFEDQEADGSAGNGDAPPSYTPAADSRRGETTLEVGPRRPFQSAPQPPAQSTLLLSPQPIPSPRPTHGRSQSSSRINSRAQTVPERLASLSLDEPRRRRPSTENTLPPPPPPRHPASPSARHNTVPRSRSASDFVHDFYAAGPLSPSSSSDSALSPHTPITTSTRSGYLAPPGSPPESSSSVLRSRSTSSLTSGSVRETSDFALDFYASGEGGPSTSGPRYAPPSVPPPNRSNNPTDVPDDAKPTRTPVPGHPLLKDNQTLVYPAGYTCDKCKNTGYKHNDPSHPCRKCWTKYGKPYAGALVYAPWSNDASSTSGSGAGGSNKTLQRPLPRIIPAGSTPDSIWQSPGRTMTSAPPPMPRIEFTDPYHNPPPPGSLVVSPGDPRLGGQLCWRCGGGGTTSSFLFDERPCGLCGGAGRVY